MLGWVITECNGEYMNGIAVVEAFVEDYWNY